VQPATARPGTPGAVQLPAHWSPGAGSPGQRLPDLVQRKMEAAFGTRFDDVRVHVGPQAPALGALAFTHGSSLYFAPGQYAPAHPHGQRLLAHELPRHGVERTGRARNPFGAGVAVLQDPLLEAEAERMSLRATLHPEPALPARRSAVQPALAKLAPGGPRAAIQRSPSGVIQRVHEGALTAISNLAKAYELAEDERIREARVASGEAKSKGRPKKVEEIQAMYVGGNVVISSNYPDELSAIEERFRRANDRAKTQAAVEGIGGVFGPLFGNVTTSSTSSSALAAARGLGGGVGRLIILQGASEGGSRFHAEQNLLLVLAHYLNGLSGGGAAPADVEIRGIKPPCDTCAPVLAAFNTAYRAVYHHTINFSTDPGEGRGGSSIYKLDLKDRFPSASGNFATFVDTYDALAFPGRAAARAEEERRRREASAAAAARSSSTPSRTGGASTSTVRNRRDRRAAETTVTAQPPSQGQEQGWGWREGVTVSGLVGAAVYAGWWALSAYWASTAGLQKAPDPARPKRPG